MFGGPSSTNIGELVIFLVGLTFLLAGFWLFFRTLAFLGVAKQTTGNVVDVEERVSEDPDTVGRVQEYYYAIIEFTTADGATVRAKSQIGHGRPPRIGDTVSILYDPRRPEDIREATFTGTWLFPSLTIGIGGLATLIGVLLLLS